MIIQPDQPVLVTGAAGFLGRAVVASLLARGLQHIRCLVRPSGDVAALESVMDANGTGRIEIVRGNLLSRADCERITRDVRVIYHLAAGTGTKSFADAFLNSVVTTRNLIEAALQHKVLQRFVSLSSFTVYTNDTRNGVLDESCPVEDQPASRGEAYHYAKAKQDELILKYHREHGLPCVLIRPGVIYGPGKNAITGRVGLGTFGLFLHLGGGNPIPLTYVQNCADAVALAGLTPGIDGEVFNLVDDDLPTSRTFLRLYKKHVRRFPSIYVPHAVSYLLCYLWEKYSARSGGQLPPAYNRKGWRAYWKKTRYSNARAKERLGWTPAIPTSEGLQRFFEACRKGGQHA